MNTYKQFGAMHSIAIAATIIAAIVVITTACTNPADPSTGQQPTTGTVTGKAVFANSANSSGITITLEQSDGLRSVAVIDAQRSLAQGVPGARALSMGAARSIAGTAKTDTDGSYTLRDVPAGAYTLYASSQNSMEKAVAMNITVRANEVFDAGTLNLTPVGSIKGKITVDDSGMMGFLVGLAGTSFMAVTGSDGSFTISGIPAGSGYYFIVIKGNYTALYSETAQTVTGGETIALQPETKNITVAELNVGSVIEIGINGNWYINGVDTGIKAQGADGKDGKDGDKGDKGDSGSPGEPGANGDTPYIGDNGNWWIGTTDTGIKAQGEKGDKGDTGVSIVWKGELASAPANPEPYWAYFNTANGNAYIYTGTLWELLSQRGTDGTNGTNGVSINWRGTFTSHPENPQLNWAYYNSADKNSYIYSGSTWQVLAQGIIRYTVTFNANGGTNVTTQTVTEGATATEPTPPTKTGYACIFDGWYDESLTIPFIFSTPITADTALYAKFRPYELGETGPGGGKIFYRIETGFTQYEHADDDIGITCFYLEAAPDDMDTPLAWWEGFITYYFNSYDGIGMGQKNTLMILAENPLAPAAKACNDYSHNSKTDWFLPSRDELNILFINRAYVSNLKVISEDYEIPYTYYWSSSRFATDILDGIWAQYSDCIEAYGIRADYEGLVRAIRAF